MYDTNTERPGADETYQSATNTSDLTVEADRRGAGDVLIAAGWSQSRLGMALLRLHSEWDGAAKPRRAPPMLIEALSGHIRQEDAVAEAQAKREGRKLEKRGPVLARANDRAQSWYVSELRLLATSLKSRGVVWEQLGVWLAVKGVDPDIGAAALLHWLNPVCPHCVKGLRKAPGAPSLSARQCHRCRGTGLTAHPHGGAKVLAYLDDCVSKARQNLKNRLHNS